MLNNIKIKEEAASTNSKGKENYEVCLILTLNAWVKVRPWPLHQATPQNFITNRDTQFSLVRLLTFSHYILCRTCMYKFVFIFQLIHLEPHKHFSHCPWFFTNTDSLNPHTNPMNGVLALPPFNRRGNGTETLSNLPKATLPGEWWSGFKAGQFGTTPSGTLQAAASRLKVCICYVSLRWWPLFSLLKCHLSPFSVSIVQLTAYWFPIIK